MIRSIKILPELIIFVGLIFMVSCSDTNSNTIEPDPTPEPPSAKAMAMDLSIFTSTQPDSSAAGDNYKRADDSIDQIQAIMNRNITLAVDLLENADTANAEEISEGKWQWKFTRNQANEGVSLNYEVRLVAEQQVDEEIKWDLFLANSALSGGEKHYISGITNSEVTQGVWTYLSFGRAGEPEQEVAELDWQIDESQNVDMQLQLLVGNNFKGSQMNYNTEGAIRTIVLAPSEDEKTTIEFNSETNAGFIIAPNYNNGEKACWNSDFKNVDCSEI